MFLKGLQKYTYTRQSFTFWKSVILDRFHKFLRASIYKNKLWYRYSCIIKNNYATIVTIEMDQSIVMINHKS